MSSTQESIDATFYCSECGKAASTVRFVPSERQDPRIDANRDLTKSPLPGISITGGPVPIAINVVGDWAPAAIEALRNQDAAALYAVNNEFAPFWCRTCEKSYCADHWVTLDLYDEGFFDYTRGTCPKGHQQMLMD